ncbi:MAG: hypothetical protein ACYCQI_13070 [Gammaproteobacteria bacterium]
MFSAIKMFREKCEREKNYIIFKSKYSRKMLVIDGQPYYQSTGVNSKNPNIWFPFIMIKGTKPINLEKLPPSISKEAFHRHWKKKKKRYIKKFLDCYLHAPRIFPKKPDLDAAERKLNQRIPTKETLIVSARLSGEAFPQKKLAAAGLSTGELALAKKTLRLKALPVSIINDPDEANQWLISQGAMIAGRVLDAKPQSTNHMSSLFTKLKKKGESKSQSAQQEKKKEIKLV